MSEFRAPITERHVQAIWYDDALRPKNLVTRRGTELHVVHPGEWNLGAGPDFTGAVLEVGRDRRRLVGDVEIHLCPSDWDLHGHGTDPHYRNVVAHVTWGCGPEPSSLPPGCLSIWLGRFKTSEPGFSPEEIDLAAYPYARLPSGERPCEQRIGHDPDVGQAILAEAGRHRLRLKARRLVGRLCERRCTPASARQVFYEEVMHALGYTRNSTSFRHIAERLPFDALPQDTEAVKTAFLVAASFEEWNRIGIRPCNTPEHRLSSAAEIFTRTPIIGFSEAQDFSRASCRTMIRQMCGEKFMGKGRAAAILANIVVPFALAEDHVSTIPDWLPPEDISQPVRLTAFRLFGRDHNPSAFYARNGLHIQGLIQIYRDYCLQIHPDCDTCTLEPGFEPAPSCAH